jgi:Pro-kumamolisin, activation domain/Divergent InlB B-repeat domain
MKNAFRSKLATATCASLLLLSTGFSPAAEKILSGQVPAATVGLTAISAVPAATRLHLAIGLPLRNQEALNGLLQQIYDPASPNYHHYLTPEQFTENFGPSPDDYQRIIDFTRTNGLTVTSTYSNRMVLGVTGAVSDIEKAFHVTMRVYQHPTERRTFYAPDAAPSIDASLPILHVSGLDNFTVPQPLFRAIPLNQVTNMVPASGSGPDGLYQGNDFRNAYVPNVTLNGSGQTVALFELDGYFASDITEYESQAGLPAVPLQNISVDGFSGPNDPNGIVEVSLDIEMAISMAQEISKVIVYQGNNTGDEAIITDMLNQIATDNLAKQISSSWLLPDNATWDQIYLEYAAQGQTFLQASGDNGAFDWTVQGQQRTDDPYITLVGGTTLTAKTSNGAWISETVWNWNTSNEGTDASGGGISPTYAIPTWQQGISMSANGGSITKRNIPDVALTADNIYVIANNGSEFSVGGTSAAAPLWAGFIALVNQQVTAAGNPAVGFINPAIYSIGKSPSQYAADFHDITTGNNLTPFSSIEFFAVPGYDLCTGFGTPNGLNLISDLAGRSPRTGFLHLSVTPPSASTLLNSTPQTVFVTVNDGGFDVTNATVTAVIPGVTNLTLLNDGQPPDVKSNDAIYSATFQVPALVSSLTMTVTASAANEIGATNVVYYSVVQLPPNDNFANATKVPSVGATYLANNQFATIETNEPAHDGDKNDAASLWWNWTSATATNVFIDTIGSKIDTVLAVYTGSALLSLQPVVAASGNVSQFKPAYVSFNAQANVTYRIAVASVSSNSLGSLVLHITPGGQLDTVAPVVSVVSPLSGQTVSSHGILLSGIATDPQPNASGVNLVKVSVNGIATIANGTTNWTVPVALQPELNIIKVTAVDEAGNFSSATTVEVNYLPPAEVNDFFVNAIALSGTSGVVSGGSTNATKEAGEPFIVGNPGGKSVWWSFTPPTDGVLTLNTTNSTFDTLLGLFTGPDVADLTPIAENDDAYPGAPGGFSFISQAVRSNQTYEIDVDGFDGVAGNVSLSYSFAPTPVYQLVAGNTAGGSVQLSVVNALGGISILPGQSGDFAGGSTVTLSAIPSTTSQFNNWSGGISSSANPLTFVVQSNVNLTANFVPLPFTDGFESGDLSHLSWTTAGDAPWFVQTNIVAQGQYAARSGIIANSQTSSLILITNFSAGTGSFDYKVSSETNWDFLNFYVDGILYKQWSGEAGWANFTFSLTAGMHTLEWSYAKDPSLSSGLDAAFIDDVTLPIGSSGGPPPQLELQHQNDGSLLMTLTGQGNGQYVIQTSTNLVAWQNFSTNTAIGGVIQITIPANPTNPAQFYRAFAL